MKGYMNRCCRQNSVTLRVCHRGSESLGLSRAMETACPGLSHMRYLAIRSIMNKSARLAWTSFKKTRRSSLVIVVTTLTA